MLIVGIAAVIVLIVFTFGGSVLELFNDTCDSVTAKTGGDCT